MFSNSRNLSITGGTFTNVGGDMNVSYTISAAECASCSLDVVKELQLGIDSRWITLIVQRIIAKEMMHQLQRLQLQLPPRVGYSNENALIITDALGETLTIPWSLVSSYKDLHENLVRHFRSKIGEEWVGEERYCVARTNGGTLVDSETWSDFMETGEGLTMIMLLDKFTLWDDLFGEVVNSCPKCGWTRLGVYQDNGWHICRTRRCSERPSPPPPDDRMTVQAASVSISDLKKVKNSVIGNPLAKDGIVGDEGLMRTLIDSIEDSGNDVPEDIKTEAAHIVASLSYGSELALSTLLKLNTPYVLVFALSRVSADGPAALRAAYARALRALVSSIADVVGPSEYGLRPETPSSLRLETKEALDGMFALDTLDTILPLLLSPSPQIVTPIVQLIGSATRSSVHRSILVSWLPPDERRKEQGKAKKRGWEKLSASPALVLLLARTKNTDVKLQEAVLLALAALAKENAPVAVALGRGLGLGPDVHGIAPLALVLNYTKSRNVEVQLAACLCATHIIRGISSTHLPPTSSNHSLSYAQSVYASLPLDDACIRAVVNMVNRVVGAEGLADVERRVKACFVLYHLTTDDKALCQFAFERGCLDTLAGAVKSITPPDPVPVPAQAAQEGLTWRWDESESEGVTRLREIYLEQGLMPRLVHLLLHSGDSAIRMNALWAIKNLLYKSSTETKRDVMRELGWPRVFELLHDPDLGIQEQAYHVVRNLSETEDGIEMVFREMGADAILESITESISLDSGMAMTTPVSPTSPSTSTGAGASTAASSFPPHPLQDRTPTILQAISTLANLCNGPPRLYLPDSL
ncbi:hypothetical protein H1R20_g7191, partial [Candolleomyces eurysporus]